MRDRPTQPIRPTMNFYALWGLLLFFWISLTPSTAVADEKALWAASDSDSALTVDHARWDDFLKTYVQLGQDGITRVAYSAVTPDDRRVLASYIADLESQDITSLNRNEQFAYWANLYNAVTVAVILDAYPVESIKDIKPGLLSFGPWKKDRVTVLGQRLSLDDIEHGILRTSWQDPRVHYALNCASIGCPNLRRVAYRGDMLDSQLDQAARAYINHPRGARLINGELHVASIYQWFQEDFGDTDQGVIDHLKLYAAPDFASALNNVTSIKSDSYDWSLNDAASSNTNDEGSPA